MRSVLIPAIVVVLILAILLVAGGLLMSRGMAFGMMGAPGLRAIGALPRAGFVAGLAMTCLSALALGAIIALVIWLTRQAAPEAITNPSLRAPLEVLQTRYAGGEITKEQYDQIRRDLGG